MEVEIEDVRYRVTPIPPFLWAYYNLYQRYITEVPEDLEEAERWEEEKTRIWERIFTACCMPFPETRHQARLAVEVQKLTQRIADEAAEDRLFRLRRLLRGRSRDGSPAETETQRPSGTRGRQP
jgi:hypothetical protein